MILHAVYFGVGMVAGVFVCLMAITFFIEYQEKRVS